MNNSLPMKTNRPLALITGAAGGLGKAFAVECASRGWDVFLTDLSPENLETLAQGIRSSYGVDVHTHACNLTDADSRQTLFDLFSQQHLSIAALINVAGLDHEGLFYDQTVAKIQSIIRLNIEATVTMTHAMMHFRDLYRPFRIINVASLAAYYPMPVKATYAASKRFLLDFSLALREEIRSLGATVTVLCPAGMPTNIDCIRGIDAQGWMGQVTTMDVGRVAKITIDAALSGKAVVIPGLVNRVMQGVGALIPTHVLAKLIGKRWLSAREKRPVESGQNGLKTVEVM